jgi:hypothetical protein
MGYREGRKWGSFTALAMMVEEGSMRGEEADRFGDQLAGNCVPPSVTYQQLIDVAVRYMQDNPGIRHESARTLVWQSFNETFPCTVVGP